MPPAVWLLGDERQFESRLGARFCELGILSEREHCAFVVNQDLVERCRFRDDVPESHTIVRGADFHIQTASERTILHVFGGQSVVLLPAPASEPIDEWMRPRFWPSNGC